MQTTIHAPRRIRFEVAEVVPSTKLLPEVSVKAALERTTRTKALICPNGDAKVLEQGDFHPLIAAAFLAFKQHYPLVLSPDMIWLTILQGVAQHVQNHAEALRDRLVHHSTKIELVVETNLASLPQNDAQMLLITREFADRIAGHVPADKQFLFHMEFSTSTDVDRIARCVALMDAFQPYFDYVMYCICGIPSVILEGSPEDWTLLKSKVECLDASDLDITWWTKHLLPLCDQFVRATAGEVDRSHWQNLCKVIERYGVDDLNGWLLKFIPYLKQDKNEPAIHRNPVLEMSVFPDPTAGREEAFGKVTGCTSKMLPSGISRAPIKCVNRETGETEEFEFVAGFAGVTQCADDFGLRPLTGWAICEGTAIDRQIARLRLQHEVLPPVVMHPWHASNRTFGGGLPADVWRFYSETNGAIVALAGADVHCRILPLDEIKPAWNIHDLSKELQDAQKRGDLSVQEFKEQQDFNWTYGKLVRIADLGNGSWYVFGHYPEIWRREAKAVFLWTGERNAESFIFAAPSFTDWLNALLDGQCVQTKVPPAE